jgi:polar amino acid transport system substrate-binding protein
MSIRDEDKPAGSTVSRRDIFQLSAGAAGVAAAAGLVGGAVLGPQAALAQTHDNSKSKLYEVLKRGKLIVGTGSTNPPWHFEDRSGKLVGMDIDLARLISKSLFDSYDKVEFVIQGSDARIPSR